MPEKSQSKSKKVQTGVWLPEDLYQDAKIQAVREKLKISSFVEKAIREYLEKVSQDAES